MATFCSYSSMHINSSPFPYDIYKMTLTGTLYKSITQLGFVYLLMITFRLCIWGKSLHETCVSEDITSGVTACHHVSLFSTLPLVTWRKVASIKFFYEKVHSFPFVIHTLHMIADGYLRLSENTG